MAATLTNFVGFETQGNEEANAVTGTVNADETSIVKSGASALRLGSGSEGANVFAVDVTVTGGPADAGGGDIRGFAFRYNGSISGTNNIFATIASSQFVLTVALNTSGQLELYDLGGVASGTLLDTSSVLSADTWYYIEVYNTRAASGGSWEWFIDGVSEGSNTNGAFSTTAPPVAWLRNGNGPTVYFDDVYVITGATAATDRLGGSTAASMPEVFMYQTDQTGSGADADGDGVGAGSALDIGSSNDWANLAETPLSGTAWSGYAAANSSGSVDLLGPGRKFSGPYYFDASDAGPQDDQAVWTNDSNAFDNSTSTTATCSTGGSSTNNELRGEGTNAPASGGTITSVFARIWSEGNISATANANIEIFENGGTASLGTSQNLGGSGGSNVNKGEWFELSAHSGGWTWAKVQALEVAFWTPSQLLGVAGAEVIVEESSGTQTLAHLGYGAGIGIDSPDLQGDTDGSITAIKGIWYAERGSGKSTTFTNWVGNDGGVAGDMVSTNPTMLTMPDAFFLISSDASAMPTTSENLRQGFQKGNSSGYDYECDEMWATILHCPPHPSGDLTLLSDTEFPDQNYFVGPFEV